MKILSSNIHPRLFLMLKIDFRPDEIVFFYGKKRAGFKNHTQILNHKKSYVLSSV